MGAKYAEMIKDKIKRLGIKRYDPRPHHQRRRLTLSKPKVDKFGKVSWKLPVGLHKDFNILEWINKEVAINEKWWKAHPKFDDKVGR
jgi:hypothetical protein